MEIGLFLALPLLCIFIFLFMIDRMMQQVDPECGGLKFGQAVILTASIICFGICGFIVGKAITEEHFTETVIPKLKRKIMLENQRHDETWEITEISPDTLLLVNYNKNKKRD